jgi:hypothetical protein
MIVFPQAHHKEKEAELGYVVLDEFKCSSRVRKFRKNRKNKDGAGHAGFLCLRTSNEQKYEPISDRAGVPERYGTDRTTFEPLALPQHGARLCFMPETDHETEVTEDLDSLGREDSTCISEAPTLYTYVKPKNRSTHRGQCRGKPICSIDSDDMSLFTSNESLLYGQFPNSFMSIVDEDDESETTANSANSPYLV